MKTEFFMFMGYIFTASLLIFIFVLLPLWYIGRNNADKRKETRKKLTGTWHTPRFYCPDLEIRGSDVSDCNGFFQGR